jgi:hypothetical protein
MLEDKAVREIRDGHGLRDSGARPDVGDRPGMAIARRRHHRRWHGLRDVWDELDLLRWLDRLLRRWRTLARGQGADDEGAEDELQERAHWRPPFLENP